jgi:hypothetical protein
LYNAPNFRAKVDQAKKVAGHIYIYIYICMRETAHREQEQVMAQQGPPRELRRNREKTSGQYTWSLG